MNNKKKLKNKDYVFLTAMLNARQVRMLTDERMQQANAAQSFQDAAKLVEECGYPDMSGMNDAEVNAALSDYRAGVFAELGGIKQAEPIVDLFRLKYDYHNIKVLAKAMGENLDGGTALSSSGRVPYPELTEAFISGERQSLPPLMTKAMSEAVGILSRTENPQLADIAVDALYFEEYMAIAVSTGNAVIINYAKLMVDSANLRAAVRTLRMGRDVEFLKLALIPGGSVAPERFYELSQSGAELEDMFHGTPLAEAARLGVASISGGTLTQFELTADNVFCTLLGDTKFIAFGPESVFRYLAAIEAEITAVRMILTGKLMGIEPDTVRERMRRSYV